MFLLNVMLAGTVFLSIGSNGGISTKKQKLDLSISVVGHVPECQKENRVKKLKNKCDLKFGVAYTTADEEIVSMLSLRSQRNRRTIPMLDTSSIGSIKPLEIWYSDNKKKVDLIINVFDYDEHNYNPDVLLQSYKVSLNVGSEITLYPIKECSKPNLEQYNCFRADLAVPGAKDKVDIGKLKKMNITLDMTLYKSENVLQDSNGSESLGRVKKRRTNGGLIHQLKSVPKFGNHIWLTDDSLNQAKRFPSDSFVNFSNFNVDAARSALNKGLKFVPNPTSSKDWSIITNYSDANLAKFANKIRWRFELRDVPSNSLKPVAKLIKQANHTATAPTNRNLSVEKFISDVTNQVNLCNKRSQRKWLGKSSGANLSRTCVKAVAELAAKADVVIKKIDKGNTLAIMQRQQYINIGFEHLRNEEVYRNASPLEFQEAIANIILRIDKLKQAGEIRPELAQFMDPLSAGLTEASKIYFLPKTHKLGLLKGRPIISSCKAPTAHISAIIDLIILPIATAQSTYLKDTKTMVKLLKKMEFTKGMFMAVWDLVSMYVSIPHAIAIQQLKQSLLANTAIVERTGLSVETLLELTDLVIRNNFFSFNGIWYKQIKGLAMGSRASPELADIAVFEVEKQLIQLAGHHLDWWLRYRDDVFFLWKGTAETYLKFAKLANELVPHLCFEQSCSQKAVNLLDLTIYSNPAYVQALQVRLYIKPCNTRQFFPPCSNHTPETKKGLVTGELTRYWQNSSVDQDFARSAEQLFVDLQKRGFHASSLLLPARQFMKSKFEVPSGASRTNQPVSMATVYLPLKYYTGQHKLKRRLRTALNHFASRDPLLASKMELERITIAFSVMPNLNSILVRSGLKTNDNSALDNLMAALDIELDNLHS